MDNSESSIEYEGVTITSSKIKEMDDGRTLIAVNRDKITNVACRKGWQAENPKTQIIAGCVLIAFGMLPVPAIVKWLIYGGRLYSAMVWLTTLVVIGAWLFYSAFKRGLHLSIEGPNLCKKICFLKGASIEGVNSFIQDAERKFGYTIKREGC